MPNGDPGGFIGGFIGGQEAQADIAGKVGQEQRRKAEEQRTAEEYAFQLRTRGAADRTLQILSGAGGPPGPMGAAPQPGQPPQQPAWAGAAQAQPAGPSAQFPAPQGAGGMLGGMRGTAPGETIGGPGAPEQPRASTGVKDLPSGYAPGQEPERPRTQPPRGYLGTGGPLTARELIDAAVRANPGAGPGEIYGVVNSLLPLMKIEEQAAWHEATVAQRQAKMLSEENRFYAKLDETRRRHDQQEYDAQQKVDLAKTDQDRKAAQLALNQLKEANKQENAALDRERQYYGIEARREVGLAGVEQRREATATRAATAEAARQTKLDIAAQTLGTRERVAEAQIAGRQHAVETAVAGRLQVAELNAATRTAIVDSNQEFKRELTEFVEGRKDYRQGQSENFKRELDRMHASDKRELTEFLEQGRMFRAGAAETGRRERARELLLARSAEKAKDREMRERISANTLAAAKERFNERFGLQQTKYFGLNPEQTKDVLTRGGVTPDEIDQAANYINFGQVKSSGTLPQTAGMAPALKAAFTRTAWNVADAKLQAQGETNYPAYRTTQAGLVAAAQKTLRTYLGAGPQGDQARFLSVAQGHLETALKVAEEWKSSGIGGLIYDAPVLNKVKAWLAENVYGGKEATNSKLVSQVLGTEIIKSLAVARAGTAEERNQAQSNFTAVASWEQLVGAVRYAQELLDKQREGMRAQFAGSLSAAGMMSREKAGELFDSMGTQQLRDYQYHKNKEDENWRAAWENFDADKIRSKGNKDADVGSEGRRGDGTIHPFWWLPKQYRPFQ